MKKNQNSDLAPRRKVRNDIILVLAIVLLAIAGFLAVHFTGSQGDRVVVLINGAETASYPLSEDLETVIQTGENTNTLVINEGKASVRDASCPDKICVNHRAISKAGETIVCLPHKVVVKVVSSSDQNDVDIVA